MSIAELRRSVEGVSFDEMPMPELSVDDLDIKTAQEAFGTTAKLNEQALLTLKLLARHQNKAVPTKGGVLLFGRQRTQHFPDAWVQCGRFFGTEKIDIFDHIDIDVPLPKAVDEVRGMRGRSKVVEFSKHTIEQTFEALSATSPCANWNWE